MILPLNGKSTASTLAGGGMDITSLNGVPNARTWYALGFLSASSRKIAPSGVYLTTKKVPLTLLFHELMISSSDAVKLQGLDFANSSMSWIFLIRLFLILNISSGVSLRKSSLFL